MTARALELVAAADVIYYDRLIPSSALAGARPDAELVYVGKRPGAETMPQRQITERLIDSARQGLDVVRLKGGDPFMFGRGAEEAEAAVTAGIAYEVVPGVTAGIAATAYAGIPVTHRQDASAVAFVTGHEDPGKAETAIDWSALAVFPGTLVFYMGVRRLPAIASALIEAGRSPDEPAATVEQGTTSRQRALVATLATIGERAAEASVKAPALIVVGEVARHRNRLAWFENRPLHGQTVVVTRARAQAGELAGRLRTLGAEVVELPTIRIEPPADTGPVREAVGQLTDGQYALVCVTSPNAAMLLFEAVAAAGLDSRALAGTTVAAIGSGTARALADRGVTADLLPERAVSEGLLEALDGFGSPELDGARVLLAQAEGARPVLATGLRERGARVDAVTLYRTVSQPPDRVALEAAHAADWFTFTSASTVTGLLDAMPDGPPSGAQLISIGPVTSAAIREAGFDVACEADPHDLDGLITALLAAVAGEQA
jgi:uroporphyrinogen III methyltransferase/synthase